MPGFAQISGTHPSLTQRFDPQRSVLQRLPVPFGSLTEHVDVFRIYLPQSTPAVACYLLRCPAAFEAFGKNSPETALLFSRAVIEFLRVSQDLRFDVVHCNDWHTGLIPVYLMKMYHQDSHLSRIASVYTTHNAEGGYQGSFPNLDYLLKQTGLDQQCRDVIDYDNQLNFCKAAFETADLVNTVSEQYRDELLTPAFGGGLSGILNNRGDAFRGITNGIDVDEWNPADDRFISPHNYSPSDTIKEIRESKRQIRTMVSGWKDQQGNQPYQRLKLDSILIGVVSRIDYQKTEILIDMIKEICGLPGVQVAFLGSPEAADRHGNELTDQLRQISTQMPDALLFFNGFDIPLSHRIYAASEVFIVPSVFEPCGLTQLVAMKYGSVPIVRSVGGLVNTVTDESSQHGTGFHFKEAIGRQSGDQRMDKQAAGPSLLARVKDAVNLYLTNDTRWNELITNGMARDSSWTLPSTKYAELYSEAVTRKVESP
jgi:starch synthase